MLIRAKEKEPKQLFGSFFGFNGLAVLGKHSLSP